MDSFERTNLQSENPWNPAENLVEDVRKFLGLWPQNRLAYNICHMIAVRILLGTISSIPLVIFSDKLEDTTENSLLILDMPRHKFKDLLDNVGDDLKISIFSLQELMYNPLRNRLVPLHTLESKEKVLGIRTQRNIPLISRMDPIVRRCGFRKGSILKIHREGGFYYRIVEDF